MPTTEIDRPYSAASDAAEVATTPRQGRLAVIADYAAIARPDHWLKNVFMVLGLVLAFFYHHEAIKNFNLARILWAFAATCITASSNYVINEILDASTDRSHPVKRNRPIPAGRIKLPLAYAEWIILVMAAGAMAYAVNLRFFQASVLLMIMGVVYNVRPLRSKDLPYLDVLSEAVNNPIRLMLGWFVITANEFPPASLLVAYWMLGAFFMATKRFSEYRSIADPVRAAAYRASFRYYNEDRLLISMFVYATAASLFVGVFIIRYHLELIIGVPLIAGFFGAYLRVALKTDSSAQAPERLYREHGLITYMLVCLLAFTGLMFVRIPAMYRWFNVEPSSMPALWELH